MIVRLYTGDDGRSHFEDVALPAGPVENAALRPGASIEFRRTPAGDVNDWHHPEHPMYVITISGRAEVHVGDGTVRRFEPGDIMLADDKTGQGHYTSILPDEDHVFVLLRLPD